MRASSININEINAVLASECSQHIRLVIASSFTKCKGSSNGGTQLDSHANMIVMGKHCYIISRSGMTADVNAFSDEVGSMLKVPIVDTLMVFECPFTGTIFFLVARNVLYVESMDHNLIPPFVLREAGLICNDRPLIHSFPPKKEDHSIIDPKSNLHICLELDGVFSKFGSRSPTNSDLFESDNVTVVHITPPGLSWDPNSSHHGENEAALRDIEGEIIHHPPSDRVIFDEDETLMFDELEQQDFDRQQFVHQQADVESLRMLTSELNDSTFNGSSDTYTTADEARVSSISESAINCEGDFDLPSNFGFSPDTMSDFDIHVDSVAFVRAVSKFESECVHKMSVGSVAGHSSLRVQGSSPFVEVVPDALHRTDASISTAASRARGVSSEHLSKVWRIDKNTADRTLECTTQLKKQDCEGDVSRNFSTNDRMLRYKRINTHFFTDTFQAKMKCTSLRGYQYCQLFVSDKGFIFVVFMRKKSEFPLALKAFAKEIGVPSSLIMDPSGEQTSNVVKKFAQECSMKLKLLEESTQWADLAERYIGMLKSAVMNEMFKQDCPMILWDYCVEWRVRVHNVIAKDSLNLDGQNAQIVTTGDVPDISNLCRFGFYQWVYYWDNKHGFPEQKRRIGRALGPSRYEGNSMAQYILQENGRVVPRRTVRAIPPEHLRTDIIKQRMKTYDVNIKNKLGDSMTMPTPEQLKAPCDWVPYEDDEVSPIEMPENDICLDNFNVSLTDALINAELLLHRREDCNGPLVNARVVRKLTDKNGNLIGHANKDINLNTIMYEVEFDDGQCAAYAANVIAQEIYSSVDAEGRKEAIIEEIIGFDRNSKYAVPKEKQFFYLKGKKHRRRTTAGWKLLTRCSDGSEQWVPLKDMKETYPVQVSVFAKTEGLLEEPAFAWWTPYVLRKASRIISKVKARMMVATHKYGIEVPSSINHAKELDKKNGNTLWMDGLNKEMTNVSIAFDFLDHGVKPPPGYTKSSGHLIWDLKMDFTRKARWVKDGHRTPDPTTSNYAGVVSRESVRIAFTYAALNGLDVFAADVQNAYLQAPTSEKHYIICGDEFGIEHRGKVAIITRALYGGKFAGRDYWKHMRSFMNELGFISCKADSDVWMRKAVTDRGVEYWEYVLLYVDDILCVSHRGEDVLRNEIGVHFTLKESSIGPPDQYLGGKVRKRTINTTEGDVEAWTFSSTQYVKEAVNNVSNYLKEHKSKLPKDRDDPIKRDYRPELDESAELSDVDAAYFQSLIGVLRWIVELGRVDINCEVSMLSSCMALPRYGHLEQLYNMFAYLKRHNNTEVVYDPSEPVINMEDFPREDWTDSVYATGGAVLTEPVPTDAPESRGAGFVMRLYVDADHAGDCITRRSRTGFLVYVQNTLVYAFSKKQPGVETSSFGSEFMAMKVATEYVRGLRYKLRMMGIDIRGPCYVYGDNKAVLRNSALPDSQLKKKSNSIAFHHTREGSARDEWRITYINTDDNPADSQTKPLPYGAKRVKFCKQLLKHMYAYGKHIVRHVVGATTV